jgi:hypothetical protein
MKYQLDVRLEGGNIGRDFMTLVTAEKFANKAVMMRDFMGYIISKSGKVVKAYERE